MMSNETKELGNLDPKTMADDLASKFIEGLKSSRSMKTDKIKQVFIGKEKQGNSIYVTTSPIYLFKNYVIRDMEKLKEDILVGSFIIRIPIKPKYSGIQAANLDFIGNGHPHPFISSGLSFCLGAVETRIIEYYKAGDFASIIDIIILMLETPESGDPYLHWEDWLSGKSKLIETLGPAESIFNFKEHGGLEGGPAGGDLPDGLEDMGEEFRSNSELMGPCIDMTKKKKVVKHLFDTFRHNGEDMGVVFENDPSKMDPKEVQKIIKNKNYKKVPLTNLRKVRIVK